MASALLEQSLGGPFSKCEEGDESVLHKCLQHEISAISSKSTMAKKLRYIHVTKCAGSSIEHVSGKSWGRHDMDYLAATADIYTKDGSFWHVPLQYAKPYVLRDLLKKFDYFIVVRNPFERVVSEFYCQWGGAGNKRITDVQGFNAWIAAKLQSIQSSSSNSNTSSSSLNYLHGHWAPQYLYVQDGEGKLIVKRNNVLFMERLVPQYTSLIERYKLPNEFSLSNKIHLNENRDKKFCAADLNPKNVELVRRVYSLDFQYFGYSEDPPPRPPLRVPEASKVVQAPVTQSHMETNSKRRRVEDENETMPWSSKPNSRKANAALCPAPGASFADIVAIMASKKRKTEI